MKCLVISDVFPNRLEPSAGPYNRQQIEALARLCEVKVINPISWLSVIRQPKLWSVVRNGSDGLVRNIPVAHPLHVHVPLFGRAMLGRSLYGCVRRPALEALRDGGSDVIYSTWAFPHGYAAMQLALASGRPFVAKLRGSDLNELPAKGLRRDLTARTLRAAAAVIAVSRELADSAVALGTAADRVHVLHNGVDIGLFRPLSREFARRQLGLAPAGSMILFVGNLVPVKAPSLALEAFARLGERVPATLVAIGSGGLEKALKRQVAALGLRDGVRFTGGVPHSDMPLWMNAADVLCLTSRSEGCPNVVLEALACGTPVVATRVGAVPDLLDNTTGFVVQQADAVGFAEAIEVALTRAWDRNALRRRVEGMSWQENARKLHAILSAACGAGDRAREGFARAAVRPTQRGLG